MLTKFLVKIISHILNFVYIRIVCRSIFLISNLEIKMQIFIITMDI